VSGMSFGFRLSHSSCANNKRSDGLRLSKSAFNMAFALSVMPNNNKSSVLDILRGFHCEFIYKKSVPEWSYFLAEN
jgi:hypothetical protein